MSTFDLLDKVIIITGAAGVSARKSLASAHARVLN
jgi:hypothetical protein